MQDFYFKPMLSETKNKCSDNVDSTTILFLKVFLVAQLHLTFETHGLQSARVLFPW